MAFHRPHPKRISHEPVSNRELELEQVNQALRDELSNEVSINKSNEKYINELEHKYTQCEKEIQSLNKELEWLDNALEEEKAELRSEIASLKRSLYQAKKEIRDKVSYTDIIEKQLQESEERVQNLRLRFKIISSRRSSPILYNSEEDTDMAHIDPFINITRGLNRLENHFTGGTPLINPVNIIQGMYGTLNTIWANYQRIDQDLDDVTNQRDARDAQIVQLQQDVNHFRQQNIALQNHVNQLTLERNNSQNDLALMTTAYYNEREERQHWWRVAKQLEKGMQMRINTLLLDKLALNFKLRRCQRHGQEPPDDYCNKIQQAIAYADTMIADANNTNANTFTNAHKADIYKSKMAGKYVPVPAQYPNGTDIDTPDRFKAWIRFKYHELTVGTATVGEDLNNSGMTLCRTSSSTKTDDILNLSLVSSSLISTPSAVKNSAKFLSSLSTICTKSKNPMNVDRISCMAFLALSLDHLETIAMRLGYPDDESQNPDDLANFIEYELYNRLGYENYNLRKEPFGSRRNSPVIEKTNVLNQRKDLLKRLITQ
ncbi:16112_t:CDS:2 [Entrophospora sp. SA101]|nr:16112_t:CDS:2 [Entrophospora sp. SA101]